MVNAVPTCRFPAWIVLLGPWVVVFRLEPAGGFYNGCQKFVPIICHCEEPSDEAIFWKTWGIASLRSQWLLKDSLSQSEHIFDNYYIPGLRYRNYFSYCKLCISLSFDNTYISQAFLDYMQLFWRVLWLWYGCWGWKYWDVCVSVIHAGIQTIRRMHIAYEISKVFGQA
jgi:hypothetical protein